MNHQDLQAIIDFQIELNKFVNIDLFQRGLYQIRINHHINSKIPHKIEVSFLEDSSTKKENQIVSPNVIFPSSIINGVAVSKTFNILFKNEEVVLNDVIHFKDHLIVDSANCLKQISNAEFYLDVELWFTESNYVPNDQDQIRLMFRRQLKLHFNACRGLHYYLPVTFDYFHLSTVTLSVHACLVTLCLPYLSKQGLNNSKSGELETTCNGLGYDYLFFGCSFNEIQNQIRGNCTELLKLRERRAQLLFWQLSSLLFTSIQNLNRKFNEYLKLLPPLLQCKYRKDKSLANFQLNNLSNFAQQCHRSCLENGLKSGSQDFIHFQNIYFAKEILNQQSKLNSNKKSNENSISVKNKLIEVNQSDNPDKIRDVEIESEIRNEDQDEIVIKTKNETETKLDKNENVLTDNSSIYQPEDYIATIVSDLAYICGSLIVTWQYFVKLVTHNDKINQHQSKIHHLHRCKRYSEAFFVKEKSLNQLIALPEQDNQLFYELSEKLRKSKYLQSLPVCQIECVSLDGDYQTMPIIFEEKFNLTEELIENNNKKNIDKSKEQDAKNANNENDKEINEKILDKPTTKDDKNNLRRSSSDLSTNSNRSSLTSSSLNSATNSFTDNTNNSAEDKPQQKLKLKDKFLFNLNKLNGSITRRKSSISYLSKQEQQKIVLNENLSTSSSTNNSNNSSLNSQSTSKSLSIETNETDILNCSPKIVLNDDDQVDGIKEQNSSGKELSRSIIEELGDCPTKLISFRHYNNVKGELEEFLSDNNSCSVYSSIVETISLNNIEKVNSENSSKNLNKNKKNLKKMASSESLPDLSIKHLQKTIKRMTKKNSKRFKIKKSSRRIKSAQTKSDILIDTISLNFSTNIDSLNEKSLDAVKNELNDENLEKTDSTLINLDKTETKNDKLIDESNQNNSKCTILEMFTRNTCLVCGIENCDCTQDFELTFGSKRMSMITNELVSFVKAKEQFRQEMNLKTNGWQIYSDFLYPASRIPYFQDDSDLVKMFNSEKDGIHLVICVHGLDGNCADLRLVKTYLELGLPTCNFDFLMSESNTGRTYESFEVMTNRLCEEILKHIQSNCLQPSKVSFIGHSLGNIIIRSVLRRPELDFLLPKLNCFLSLSGPHLGTIYMTNSLVNIGLWVMQKFKKSTSLLQLCLKDNADPYKTFIYNLSKDSKMHLFKYVLLLGSSQDHYVPRHSAHIQVCNQSNQDYSPVGQAYRDMINNIIKPFLSKPNKISDNLDVDKSNDRTSEILCDVESNKCNKLMRFDVFHTDAGGTNSLIGRQAHIAVLDCELFIEKFMTIVGLKYFA